MSNCKRVLFIASVYKHLAAFHRPYMKLLIDSGFEVHAAASDDIGKVEVENLGVKTYVIPFARTPYSFNNFTAYRYLKRLMKHNNYGFVHVHTPVAAFLTRLVARSINVPVIYTAHGFHFYCGAPIKNWVLYYTAEKIAAPWTAALVVMNEEDLAVGERLGFIKGKNLFFVHGVGVDLEKYGAVPKKKGSIRGELGFEDEDCVIACVGEMNANKNQGFLLNAWKEVEGREGRARLLLIGEGEMRASLEKKKARENLKHVYFLGFREDVPEILSDTDIVVLVSQREGLPRAVMEAMAAGRPVIATNVRGNRDLVAHGVTGYLVPLGDVEALEDALVKLAKDRELAQQMGVEGRKRIAPYAVENVVEEMRQVYSRFLIN